VRSSRWNRLILFSITPKGFAHSQYRRHVKKAASFNAAERVSGHTLNVVMVLSEIGEVRSLHVTRLIRNLGREVPDTTKVMHSLRKSGYVERVGSGGKQPLYRLTAAGRQWSKALLVGIEMPPRAELRRRLRAELRQKTISRRRRKKKPLRATVAKEIIWILRNRGKLPKQAINSMLAEPYSNIRGLESILYRMATRGLIVRVKREYVLADPAAPGEIEETASRVQRTETL
jgi:DNA-binding MarR family transcriptional regulator